MAELIIGTIAFIGQCYSGAIQAYITLQRCIEFSDTSAKLILQLDVQRIRLQLWGRNSGVDQGTLHPGLSPFEPLLNDILNRITHLLQNSEKLQEDYGLVSRITEGEEGKGDGVTKTRRKKVIDQVKDVLNTTFIANLNKPQKAPGLLAEQQQNLPRSHPSLYNRLRWAISSQLRFEALINELRGFINSLNELLRESQQKLLSQDWRLLELQMVADIDDPQALLEIQKATEGDDSCRAMYSMARRKMIIVSKRGQPPRGSEELSTQVSTATVLSRDDFDLPDDFKTLSRCITTYNPPDATSSQHSQYVLVEKKVYDESISSEDKGTLLIRLHRLIQLLNLPADDSSASGLLPCLGYWSEPGSNCWCLVYRFSPQSSTPIFHEPVSKQPTSLLLFLASENFRPSLESRFALASAIVSTFSHLYGSKWLHKGVRSENILFPLSASGFYDISNPLVAGFEYSRQYTEEATIDRTPFNLLHAIYRHPGYQGFAAKGYRMAYDVYSLGLVLAEIAWWKPLNSLRLGNNRVSANGKQVQVLHEFGVKEAAELRKMMIKQVRKELAFRVGSLYQGVVEWCLMQGDERERREGEFAVEFYTNVVIPLGNLTTNMRNSPGLTESDA